MSITSMEMELGTKTYRCKGCNGENCRYCYFGDMWEADTEAEQ